MVAEEFQQRIEQKIDQFDKNLSEVVCTIDDRLSKIENQPLATEELQQRIESTMDHMRSHNVQAVQEAIHEDKAEEQEIERRKANVIVHGLPESEAENSEQRIDDDLAVLATMFHEIDADDVKVVNTVRLGKKSANPEDKPRPLKLVLDSVDSKISVLKRSKNLRSKEDGGWSKIFVHQDLTPKQREARKPLVAELKERKAKGETDLIIYNGKVVQKRGY